MTSTTSSELSTGVISIQEDIAAPTVMAAGTSLLIALVVGLLWSLWWQLGTVFMVASFYTAVCMVYTQTLQRISALFVVGAVVGLAGYLFGPAAAGSTSFVLLLPLGIASLRFKDVEPA